MQNIVFSGWLDMVFINYLLKINLKLIEMAYLKKKTWRDYNLVWDPEEFGNISKIRLPVNKIWIPGIYMCSE